MSALKAPLLVSARTAAFVAINGVSQPANGTLAYAALLPAVTHQAANIANVNPLTDKVASDVAVADLKLKGSVQLINACNTTGVTEATVAAKTADLRTLLQAALTAHGVAGAAFDPVTTPMSANHQGVDAVLDRLLRANAPARVVNLAQSGRSSRSFITEGWFKILADGLQAGDYLLIQWGHNDEKCDTTGSLDWVNRCTYPNDANGTPQGAKTLDKLPAGTTADDLSFQRSLEKYIALAKSKGATPVLITPVTRINQDKAVAAYVEGAFPISKSTHITTKGDAPGNYARTVLDTAAANDVAVVDVDAASIAFFNTLGVGTGGATATGGWRDHYLAVSDAVAFPFYAAATTTGHYLNADRTHFQESGAVTIAGLVAAGVKADTARLGGLIALMK